MAGPAASPADETPLDQRHGGGSNVVVSFGPWIAVWVLTSNSSFVPGLIVATLVSIALISFSYWEGTKPKLLDWGTLAVMATMTIVGLVAQEAWLGNWLNPILNASLLLIMVVSIAIGRPFTLEYAKEQAPREVWDTPDFTRINLTITLVWTFAALAMTIGSLVDSVYSTGIVVTDPKTAKNVETWANWGVTIIALVVAMKFTSWFPNAYMERKQRLAGGT